MSNTLNNFFRNRKRDRSDKSNDGDEWKKAKESNLDLSLNQDDTYVFAEGIDSSTRESVLYDRLTNLYKKVNKIHLLSTTTNDARSKALSS